MISTFSTVWDTNDLAVTETVYVDRRQGSELKCSNAVRSRPERHVETNHGDRCTGQDTTHGIEYNAAETRLGCAAGRPDAEQAQDEKAKDEGGTSNRDGHVASITISATG